MQSFVMAKPGSSTTIATQSGTTSYPLFGIACTVLGTMLAVLYVPSDVEPEWALLNSAILMSIGLAAAPIAAALRDPKSILRGEHLLAIGPIYWLLLDLLQGSYTLDTIQPDEAATAFIGIGVFVSATWLAASYRAVKVPAFIAKSVALEFSGNVYFYLAVIAFVIAMLRFAIPCNFNVIEMFSYLGENRWAAPWARGQLGGVDSFLDHLQYFGYLLPVLTVIVARYTGWVNGRIIICAGMSIIMTLFLMQGGGRRIVGVVFGAAFILWILSEKKLRIQHILIIVFGLSMLLILMQLMVEYRAIGYSEIITRSDSNEQIFERDKLHVDDNFYRFCQIIKFIPESYPYVYHQYIIWILVRPIPRLFWPGKPVDPGFDLPTALGVEGVSYSSSVLGELYMSAGLLGIALGGLLYGRLSSLASRLLIMGNTFGALVVYSILIMALFAGLRSMLELVLVSYAILAWVGLSLLFRYYRIVKPQPTRA